VTDTANLASFFTRSARTIHGPQTPAQAKRVTACVRHKFFLDSVVSEFFPNAIAMNGTEEDPLTAENQYRLDPTVFKKGLEFCQWSLQDGTSQIIVDDVNSLHQIHLALCSTTSKASWLGIGDISYVFATRGDTAMGRQLSVNLSKAIAYYLRSADRVRLEQEHFLAGESCESEQISEELKPVSFEHMRGLFVMVGGLMAGSLLLFFAAVWRVPAQRVRQSSVPSPEQPAYLQKVKKASLGKAELQDLASDPHATNNDMLRAMLLTLSSTADQMGHVSQATMQI